MVSPVLLLAAGPQVTKKSSPPVYLITYAVADLPVWRNKGDKSPEFAPEVLTTYLRATVDPKSWKKGADIRPFTKQAALVIAQTQANHEKIADALESFRENDPREVTERIGVRN
jgi:hypothetical protein